MISRALGTKSCHDVCHTSGEASEDALRRRRTITPAQGRSLRRMATARDAPTRTVNPSAYAYSGSNPLPATLVRALFFGSLLRRRSLRCHGLSQLAGNYAAPT